MINSKYLNILTAAAAAFSISISAHAAILTYAIQGNWENQTECFKTATEVAEAFKSHVTVVSSNCQRQLTGFQLQVAYAAPTKIETISTITKYIRQHEHMGGYQSKEDCLANLPRELSLFQTSTGLEPFVALCFNETGDPATYGQYDWNLRIEAMGPAPEGAYVPSEAALNTMGYFLSPEASVRKEILDALVKKGLRPAMVQAHHSSTVVNLIKIRAYAQHELNLVQTDFAYFVDGTSCLREADRVNHSAYANQGIYLTAFCMSQTAVKPPMNAPPEVLNSSLQVVYQAEGLEYNDRPQKLPGEFDTYAQCDAQRPAIIANLEQALGKPVRASFCGKLNAPNEGNTQKFFVHVIE